MRYLMFQYLKKPSGQYDEAMSIGVKLKRRDLQTMSVILDFQEQKVLQCSINGEAMPKDWDRIVSYYYEHYTATIERLFQENGHAVDIKVDAKLT